MSLPIISADQRLAEKRCPSGNRAWIYTSEAP